MELGWLLFMLVSGDVVYVWLSRCGTWNVRGISGLSGWVVVGFRC